MVLDWNGIIFIATPARNNILFQEFAFNMHWDAVKAPSIMQDVRYWS